MTVPELLASDRFAALLGANLVEHSPEKVVVEAEVGEHHLDGTGRVAPGALFSLADCAMSLISNATGTAVAIVTQFTCAAGLPEAGMMRAEARRRLPAGSPASTWEATVTMAGQVVATFVGTTLKRP